MPITKGEAYKIARERLKSWEREVGEELLLLEEHTLERDFGWVFFYDSERHVETEESEHALAGNAPIVVIKADGSVHTTGTAYPIEHYLRKFEE